MPRDWSKQVKRHRPLRRSKSAAAEIPADIQRKLNHIAEISKNARGTWLSLVAVLLFSAIAVAGVRDKDFFTSGAGLTLPVINFDVPIKSFFAVGPVLILGLYTYLHLYLLKLWRALADLRSEVVPGVWLDDVTFPWLVSDAAIFLKRNSPRRPLAWMTQVIAFLFLWLAAPMVLIFFWYRSFPVHEVWLTVWAGSIVSLSILGGSFSWVLWWQVITVGNEKGYDRFVRRFVKPMAFIWASAAFLFMLEGWAKTTGGIDRDSLRVGGEEHIYRAQLYRAELVERPRDWKSREEAWGEFKAKFAGKARSALLMEQQSSSKWLPAAEKAFETQRAAALKSLKAQPLQGISLRGADLREAFLSGLDLTGADLRGVDFRGATLEGTDLRGADLERSDLRDVELRLAHLRSAQIHKGLQSSGQKTGGDQLPAESMSIRMSGSNLAGLNLAFLDLHGGDFRNADLQKADLNGSNLQAARLQNANLKLTSLRAAELQRADFRDAKLEGANLEDARLHDADLRRANLFRTNFRGAILYRASLQEANIEGGIFYDAKLRGAVLWNAVLYQSLFDGADLTGVKFRGADLRAANFTDGILDNADFKYADLERARFPNGSLYRANFDNTNLVDAYFGDVDLSGVTFQSAFLVSADLRRVSNLSQEQLNSAFGDADTVLPNKCSSRGRALLDCVRPSHWSETVLKREEIEVLLKGWRTAKAKNGI
jgi:uncharacterized protein YjbI with pentapeptide repeats